MTTQRLCKLCRKNIRICFSDKVKELIRVEGLSGFLKSKRSRLMGTGMDENLSDAERKEEELWE